MCRSLTHSSWVRRIIFVSSRWNSIITLYCHSCGPREHKTFASLCGSVCSVFRADWLLKQVAHFTLLKNLTSAYSRPNFPSGTNKVYLILISDSEKCLQATRSHESSWADSLLCCSFLCNRLVLVLIFGVNWIQKRESDIKGNKMWAGAKIERGGCSRVASQGVSCLS